MFNVNSARQNFDESKRERTSGHLSAARLPDCCKCVDVSCSSLLKPLLCPKMKEIKRMNLQCSMSTVHGKISMTLKRERKSGNLNAGLLPDCRKCVRASFSLTFKPLLREKIKKIETTMCTNAQCQRCMEKS